MSLTYTEVMQKIMNESPEVFVPARDFISAGHEILTNQGNDISVKSAQNALLNNGKLAKAGLVRLTVGSDVYVVDASKAGAILSGDTIPDNSSPAQATAVATEPRPSGGSFYGVPVHESPIDDVLLSMMPQKIGYKESSHREMKQLAMAYKLRKHVMAIGPTGSGKTALANDFFYSINKPYARINFSEGIDEFQLVGHLTKGKDGQVMFVEGLITMAMKYGFGLVLDEVNMAEADVLSILHGVMDYGHLTIPYNDNEIVKAHPDFFIIGCINPPEDYAGAKEMNQATLSRFRWIMEVDYLDASDEAFVVMEQSGVSNPMMAEQLVSIANDCRAAKKAMQISWDCSTRNLIDALAFSEFENIKKCVKACVTLRCPSEDRELVESIIRARLA
jgi:MoxR-like ATPase